ncbi:MAG: macro domain-containing protein [Gelidibacter sp.]
MRLELHFGDITEYKEDCIVNAACTSLLGGGGVDGAIHNAAGPELKEFCKTLGGCKVGEAKLSPAFNLPSKFIIHTVGPRFLFKSEEEIQDLKNCYLNSLKIAKQQKLETLVFSNISTGVYGFPKDLAAKYSFEVITSFLMENEYPKKVILCCYDIENLELYANILKNNL